MLHIKFRGNQPAGSVEEDFLKSFYHIWAWLPSWICNLHHVIRISFPYMYLKAFRQSLVQIGTVVSEKIQFLNFRMYMTLGQGQEMTFTFNTHLPL